MKTGRFFAYNYDTGNDPYSNINLYNVPRNLPLGVPTFGNPSEKSNGLTQGEKIGIIAITLILLKKIM